MRTFLLEAEAVDERHERTLPFQEANVSKSECLRNASAISALLFGGEVSWSDMWQCSGSNDGCRLCSRNAPLCLSELQRSRLTRTVGQTREV